MSIREEKRINNNEPLKVWFWSLLTVFFLCIFMYGYLVRGVTVNIVERQAMESELSFLNTRVLDLESEYIKVKNDITPELAYNIGFVTVSSQKFVTKDTKNPGLSLVTPGI